MQAAAGLVVAGVDGEAIVHANRSELRYARPEAHARRELNVSQALLIATDLSELEIEGYLRQNVSLSNQRHLQRPLTAHCRLCHRDLCPLHGVDSSPVMACRSFLPAEAVV